MAVYHMSVKTISRADGRSSTSAAAYRAGEKIVDQRTGEVHDYTRKEGVAHAEIVLPKDAPSWANNREELWNAAEKADTRKNSTVAREFEIALPAELSDSERRRLAVDFARELVDRHGCAADVAIHAPSKEGDDRNHHAHIMLTTRRLGREGFTEKTRELDDRSTGSHIVTEWRERFATLQNERLQQAGLSERVDHRSLKDQGIDRKPSRHLGPAATNYERRTGEPSRIRLDWKADREADQVKAVREKFATDDRFKPATDAERQVRGKLYMGSDSQGNSYYESSDRRAVVAVSEKGQTRTIGNADSGAKIEAAIQKASERKPQQQPQRDRGHELEM